MASITVEDGVLRVEIHGLHKVWALKNRLEIPLANVERIEQDPRLTLPGAFALRLPGTNIPGVYAAGTFLADGDRVFWDVRDPAKAVIVHLRDDRYARLIVEVDDPAATVADVSRHVDG